MKARFTVAKTRLKPPIAGYEEIPELEEPYIAGFLRLGTRAIPLVTTRLSLRDRAGSLMMRLGLRRKDYRVLPGLYAHGQPTSESPVLVTANYKLSFDALRKELEGIDAWLLVLDTKGVNVWCAAGKGSFGTAELVSKMERLRLKEIVSHRSLILPQLGATGVSAPETARLRRLSRDLGASPRRRYPGLPRRRHGENREDATRKLRPQGEAGRGPGRVHAGLASPPR